MTSCEGRAREPMLTVWSYGYEPWQVSSCNVRAIRVDKTLVAVATRRSSAGGWTARDTRAVRGDFGRVQDVRPGDLPIAWGAGWDSPNDRGATTADEMVAIARGEAR